MLRSTVSRETRLLLETYEALLRRWSGTINLVSGRDLEGPFLHRHIEDSLALVDYLPAGVDRVLDLGSGAGLPAIPVALATGLPVDMVESDRRKAAFLQNAVATLRLRGTVWRARVETMSAQQAECITARAVAPLDALLGLADRLMTPSGTALFLKGPTAPEEVEAASKTWHMVTELLPGADHHSIIVKITHLRRNLDASSRPRAT